MKAIEVKSAMNVAKAWVNETAKGRKEVLALALEISKKSPKKRWKSLAKAMTENDAPRVKAYSLQGDAKKAAFAALRAAAKVAEPEVAKPQAKAKPKAKAKAKPSPKAKAKPALNMDALAAQLANVDDAQLAAFFNAVVAART